MRLVKYILLFIVTLLFGLYIFMPKVQLYYKAEEFLQSKNILIGNEVIESNLLGLKVHHGIIYYQGAEMARFELAQIRPYIILNSANFKNIETLGIAKRFGNINVQTLELKHSILKPFFIKLSANGSFGAASGYIDLKNHFVHIDITEAKDIAPFRAILKKGEEGWYYESKF